jgi:hypothetical protein
MQERGIDQVTKQTEKSWTDASQGACSLPNVPLVVVRKRRVGKKYPKFVLRPFYFPKAKAQK